MDSNQLIDLKEAVKLPQIERENLAQKLHKAANQLMVCGECERLYTCLSCPLCPDEHVRRGLN